MQSEFVRKVCDQCGEKFEVEKGVPLTPAQAEEWKRWVLLAWEIPLPNAQGLKPVVKVCCRDVCALNFLKTFDPEAEMRKEREGFEKARAEMEAAHSGRTDKPILVGSA